MPDGLEHDRDRTDFIVPSLDPVGPGGGLLRQGASGERAGPPMATQGLATVS
jgi:hypothetical protein